MTGKSFSLVLNQTSTWLLTQLNVDHSFIFLFQGTSDPFISVPRPEQEPMTDSFQVLYTLGLPCLILPECTGLASQQHCCPSPALPVASQMNEPCCPWFQLPSVNSRSKRTVFFGLGAGHNCPVAFSFGVFGLVCFFFF